MQSTLESGLELLPTLEQLPAMLPRSGITAVVHRSKLVDDPENPRLIDHYAQRNLLASVKNTGGLVEDPLWNRRTGHIVGGHHRLAAEDKRRGTQDYSLPVKVVDWDLKTQREVNVALNSPNAQGQYDMGKLDFLIRQDDFDIGNAGFNPTDLLNLYEAGGVEPPQFLLPEDQQIDPEIAQAAEEAADAVAEAREARDAEQDRLDHEEMLQRRKDFSEKQKFKRQSAFHISLVFPSDAHKAAFCKAIGKPTETESVDGLAVCDFLCLSLENVV